MNHQETYPFLLIFGWRPINGPAARPEPVRHRSSWSRAKRSLASGRTLGSLGLKHGTNGPKV